MLPPRRFLLPLLPLLPYCAAQVAPRPPAFQHLDLGFGFSLLGCACTDTCQRTVDSPLVPWCFTSAVPYVAPDGGSAGASGSGGSGGGGAPAAAGAPTRGGGGGGRGGNATAAPCGLAFSLLRQAYWGWCAVNVTTTTSGASPQLATFSAMWTAMTLSTVVSLAAIYLLAGCAAAGLAAGLPLGCRRGGGASSSSSTSVAAAAAAARALTGAGAGAAAPAAALLWLWVWLPGLAAALGAGHGLVVGAVVAALISLLYLSVPYAIDLRLALAMGVGVAALLGFGALGRHSRKAGEGGDALHASELE
jgi:hypothetical protein